MAAYLYDPPSEGVFSSAFRPVAAAGFDLAVLEGLDDELGRAPAVESAIAIGNVCRLASSDLPPAYADELGISDLVCAPLALMGGRFGALFADRGDAPITDAEPDRERLGVLAKVGAMIASARLDAVPSRSPGECRPLRLAREIHERVIPALSSVSLALYADDSLPPEERVRYSERISGALDELRATLTQAAKGSTSSSVPLPEALSRLGREYSDLSIHSTWERAPTIPVELEPLVEHFVTEALSNVRRHADPSRVDLVLDEEPDAVTIEVTNDGTRPSRGEPGIGLQLLGIHASQFGAGVEYGQLRPGFWHARLILPLPEDDIDLE